VRTQETNLGNLTADANLWQARQVDPSVVLSLKNGGGIRDDIGFFAFPPGSTDPSELEFFPPAPNPAAGKESGDISQFDIQGSLRFNNNLVIVDLTAEELVDIFEHAVGFPDVGTATNGRFPQVAGAAFSFDPLLPGRDTDPTSARVRSLALLNDDGSVAEVVIEDGSLVVPTTRVFSIVTLGFLANGGDGYPYPDADLECADPARTTCTVLDDGSIPMGGAVFAMSGTEQDALAEYLLLFFPRTDPFMMAETDVAFDERIQNLAFRSDTVLTVPIL